MTLKIGFLCRSLCVVASQGLFTHTTYPEIILNCGMKWQTTALLFLSYTVTLLPLAL